MHIHAPNLQAAYSPLFRYVSNKGRSADPRGKHVVEAEGPVVWTLDNPSDWFLNIPGRRLNPFFALAEVVWMWSGKGGAEFITYYNESMKQFLDPGVPYFNGAYGRRVRHYGYSELPFRSTPFHRTNSEIPEAVEVDQLSFVVNRLQADPFTRQAVVSLWDPVKDNFHVSRDYPCNNMLYFSQRDGKLNLSVVIRSNDLVWGVPYNMIQFSHLLALMAGTLGLEIGVFHVLCNNLHYYTELYPEALASVCSWAHAGEPPRYIFRNTSDMRWTLQGFDIFVSQVWDPLEKSMRAAQEIFNGDQGHGAALMVCFHKLEQGFTDLRVPLYWKNLFLTLYAFHLRKAKVTDAFNDVFSVLPDPIRWLIADFIRK